MPNIGLGTIKIEFAASPSPLVTERPDGTPNPIVTTPDPIDVTVIIYTVFYCFIFHSFLFP